VDACSGHQAGPDETEMASTVSHRKLGPKHAPGEPKYLTREKKYGIFNKSRDTPTGSPHPVEIGLSTYIMFHISEAREDKRMLKTFTLMSCLVLLVTLLSPLLLCNNATWSGGYTTWSGGYTTWSGGYTTWSGGY